MAPCLVPGHRSIVSVFLASLTELTALREQYIENDSPPGDYGMIDRANLELIECDTENCIYCTHPEAEGKCINPCFPA